MKKVYDVIIVGAGPIGITCGIQAQKENLSYRIIEKGVMVNSLYNFPINMTFFSTSQLLEIGDVPFIAHGDKPTRREALEYFRRVAESWKLKINLYETVLSADKTDTGFKIKTTKATYSANNIIIATGFFDTPNLMGIPGENLPKVKHYFDEAHPYIGQKIIVVGAGNSAADVALETYLKGADVTMVMRGHDFKDSIKYWIRPNIINRIKEGSIKCYYKSILTEIREKEVDIKTPGGFVTLKNDFVLAMTGYRPDYIFLEKLGIEIQKNESQLPKFNEKTFQTNIAGIYIAGVIIGGLKTGQWFIENTRFHAEKIIHHIKSK
jgi:thioredoxin reductase (NADPH)